VDCIDWMRNQTGPSLAAHSKNNQSLILQWLPSRSTVVDVASLSYRIQRLTVGLDYDWLYHDDVTWLSRQRVRVKGLRPYVTYKVRLVRRISSLVNSMFAVGGVPVFLLFDSFHAHVPVHAVRLGRRVILSTTLCACVQSYQYVTIMHENKFSEVLKTSKNFFEPLDWIGARSPNPLVNTPMTESTNPT